MPEPCYECYVCVAEKLINLWWIILQRYKSKIYIKPFVNFVFSSQPVLSDSGNDVVIEWGDKPTDCY